MTIHLYDKNTLEKFISVSHCQYEQDYLIPLLQQTDSFIKNVKTVVYLLKTDTVTFPITVNETEYENSYVCSPYTAYIAYAKEELVKIKQPALKLFLKLLLGLFGNFFKLTHLNKVVHVNNWLLSTNLYPQWEAKELAEITRFLSQKFPHHAIIFRSLNPYTQKNLYPVFENNHYQWIASRQVYILDTNNSDFLHKRDTKNDYRLLRHTNYTVIPHEALCTDDFLRLETLYNLLYLEKYSYYNPQFTKEFIQLCHTKRLLTFYALKSPDGCIEGVIGYFHRNNVMTVPLIGYNTKIPLKVGLYRLLTALILQEASKNHWVINMSAGVGEFKRLRGSLGYIEHSAIYYHHLPFYRQLPWRLLKFILNHIVVPIIQKYQL